MKTTWQQRWLDAETRKGNRPRQERTSPGSIRSYVTMLALMALLVGACGTSDGTQTTVTADSPTTEAPTTQAPTTVPEPEETTTVPVAQEPRTLTLGHIFTTEDQIHVGATRFAELVEEKTGGAYRVDVFPNAELGDTVDMFSGIQGGSVDMMYSGITAYPFIDGAEVFNITAMPFLWDDYDSMLEVLNSELFAPYFEEAAQNTQVRAVAVRGEAPTRQLSSNVAVQSADDVAQAGLKIRTAASDMTIAAWTALGAQPEVIPFPDLYLSLSQGVVDAQENGFAAIRSASLFEVQEYLIPIEYIREIYTVFIAEPLWQELAPEHQQAFREAAIEAGDELTELVRTKIQEDFDFLAENMEVLEPDLDSFRTALEGAFDQFEGEFWPEGLEDQIREMQG